MRARWKAGAGEGLPSVATVHRWVVGVAVRRSAMSYRPLRRQLRRR